MGTDGSVLADGRRVRSKDEFGSGRSVFRQPENREVFVIEGLIVQKFLRRLGTHREKLVSLYRCEIVRDRHLFHDRENPRLRIIIAVGANAQVHLLGVRVSFVRRGELENARDFIG